MNIEAFSTIDLGSHKMTCDVLIQYVSDDILCAINSAEQSNLYGGRGTSIIYDYVYGSKGGRKKNLRANRQIFATLQIFPLFSFLLKA